MEQPKKVIVIDDCLTCPKWLKCKPSKELTSKQRFTVTLGVGVGKFILKGCPLDDLNPVEIEHVKELMTWNDAIDYAYHKGMYIPNERQCEELNLYGCWTSSTPEDNHTYAKIGGAKYPANKSGIPDRKPVIMISEANYTPNTISYRTGDEGDGSTNTLD